MSSGAGENVELIYRNYDEGGPELEEGTCLIVIGTLTKGSPAGQPSSFLKN